MDGWRYGLFQSTTKRTKNGNSNGVAPKSILVDYSMAMKRILEATFVNGKGSWGICAGLSMVKKTIWLICLANVLTTCSTYCVFYVATIFYISFNGVVIPIHFGTIFFNSHQRGLTLFGLGNDRISNISINMCCGGFRAKRRLRDSRNANAPYHARQT